jgi:hypothetical protein
VTDVKDEWFKSHQSGNGAFHTLKPGLPDGFFSDQKCQVGYILEDLGMEKFVINSGHLDYYMYLTGIG